jgi:nucleoside-diphosphate-sugar epimerase
MDISGLHLVLGTGAIGRAVANELLIRGAEVRLVNRSGSMAEAPAGIEILAADLYDPANVRAVTEAAHVVYQCAQPRYTQWPQKFPPLQASILEGLAGGSAKLVIAENLYLFGDPGGKTITEDLPHAAHTRKGRTRAEMSDSALAAHRAGKVRVTIGRAPDYFGPWGTNSTMGGRVFFPLFRGKPAQLIGRLDMPHTHTYVNDFGKALVILGERDEADGKAWNVPNDMPQITQGELVRMFCEQANLRPRLSSMGKTMLRLASLFVPEARESVEMMYEFEQPFIVDSSKFEKAFGMRATPMPEALHETAAWYRGQVTRQ